MNANPETTELTKEEALIAKLQAEIVALKARDEVHRKKSIELSLRTQAAEERAKNNKGKLFDADDPRIVKTMQQLKTLLSVIDENAVSGQVEGLDLKQLVVALKADVKKVAV